MIIFCPSDKERNSLFAFLKWSSFYFLQLFSFLFVHLSVSSSLVHLVFCFRVTLTATPTLSPVQSSQLFNTLRKASMIWLKAL